MSEIQEETIEKLEKEYKKVYDLLVSTVKRIEFYRNNSLKDYLPPEVVVWWEEQKAAERARTDQLRLSAKSKLTIEEQIACGLRLK